jgi:CheY-like chemotaxis protein
MARIIVIDDDPALLRVVARALTSAGHSVLRCENGRKAIEFLAQEDADLLITDILMPEMDGLETVRAVRKLRPQLPILAMSGGGSFGPVDYLGIASAFGTTAVLPKPFLPAELLAMVQRLLVTGASD